MHSEVAMTSAFTKEPIMLRTLVATLNSLTQISSRLADNLGLDKFKDVYVNDRLYEMSPFKWKISLTPVEMRFKVLNNSNVDTVYPLVNDHAYWESIVGADCMQLSDVMWAQQMESFRSYSANEDSEKNRNLTRDLENDYNATVERMFKEQYDRYSGPVRENPSDLQYDLDDPVDRATPGPAYDPETSYMGHNIRLAKPSELPEHLNEFIEFTCFESDSVKRVAINKHTRQMAAQYNNSNSDSGPAPVYVYSQVNYVHIKRMQDQGCVPEVVKEVRASCEEAAVPEFPYAVLMYEYPRNMMLYAKLDFPRNTVEVKVSATAL